MGAVTLHGITPNLCHLIIITLSLCKNFDFVSSSDPSLAHPFSCCHFNVHSLFGLSILYHKIPQNWSCRNDTIFRKMCVCVSRRREEVEQTERRICTEIEPCRFNFKEFLVRHGKEESYEHPSISILLSHHSHLKGVAIAIFPPRIFFLKTTTHRL